MSIIKSFQLSDLSSLLSALIPNLRLEAPSGTFGSKVFVQGLLSFITVILISSTAILAQTPNFDQLKQRFDRGEVFSAEFNHTYTDSYTGEVVTSDGNIWIDQARYKLESEGQTIVVDGETSRVYDQNRNRVIIDTYYPEDDDFAPSRMLSGIDSTYTVSEEKTGNRTKITLTTDDEFAVFAQVEILIDAQRHPLKISAWDISDNEIVTDFKNGTFIQPEPGLFKLEYPEDAEIVDMRY